MLQFLLRFRQILLEYSPFLITEKRVFQLFLNLQLRPFVLVPVRVHEIGPPVGRRDIVVEQIFVFLGVQVGGRIVARAVLIGAVVHFIVFAPGHAVPAGHQDVRQFDDAEGKKHQRHDDPHEDPGGGLFIELGTFILQQLIQRRSLPP